MARRAPKRKNLASGSIVSYSQEMKERRTDMAKKLSITLPTEMAKMVRNKVEGGAYASLSEVIREALRAWQEHEVLKAERLDHIRETIVEAINDPRPSLTAKQVRNRLTSLHGKTVKARRRGA